MAVLAAAIMLAISVVAVLRGLIRPRRAIERQRRRPQAVSLIPVLFSVVSVITMVGARLGGATRTPSASPVGETPSLSQTALGASPAYPGPSNDAPLPRLNLPVTFDYGPGPRHPVPLPSYPPLLQVGPDGNAEVPQLDPSVPSPPASSVQPFCSPALAGPSASADPIVIGPCIAPTRSPAP